MVRTDWSRHIFVRRERTVTTWKFRIGFVVLIVLTLWLSHPLWTVAVAGSLVCEANAEPSDAILIENFDPDYLAFERASQLRRAGVAPRVLVLLRGDNGTGVNAVALGTAEVMARISRLGEFETVIRRETEPISLNAAHDLLVFLQREGIRSVLVVTPLFRSKRSALVYASTLGPTGISVRCGPFQGTHSVETWTKSWHGVQQVVEQWLKLQYYRLYVLPFHNGGHPSSASVTSVHSNPALTRGIEA